MLFLLFVLSKIQNIITIIESSKIDKTFVRKGKIKEQGTDFLFWQTQSYIKRVETIEQIRQEFNIWKYGNEQRFQRVYTLIKR